MATSYIFNFTDPWTTSFNVNAFSSNGPVFPLSAQLEATAVAANTSFVLYGKGHPNYGERIQENLVHLLETMSGSVEPTFPISGQQWFRRYDIIRVGGSNWHLWNGASWDAFTPTLEPHNFLTHGEIFTDGAPTPSITRIIAEAGHPLNPSAVSVVWQDLATIPAEPHLQLMMYDGTDWKAQNTVRSSDVEPTGSGVGDLWFDTSIPAEPQLKIWDGTAVAFIPTASNFLPLAGGTMSGPIDMGTNLITDVVDPRVGFPQDAATKNYVDLAVGGSVASLDDLTDVDLSIALHPTARPFLKYEGINALSGNMEAYSLEMADISDVTATAAQVNFLVGVTSLVQTQLDAKVDIAGDTMIGPLAMSNQLITDLANPGNPQEAATKFYVDDEITNAINAQTLLAAQTEADYDNVFPNGTFVVGTGYAALDTITLSDGSLITVNGIGGGGSVATFTVTTSGATNVTLGVALTQTITSGGGTLFTLTPQVANVLSFGGTDTYLVSGSLDGAGTLTLTRNDIGVSQFAIAGFAIASHVHPSGDITHDPLSSSQLSLNAVPPTSVEDTFSQLEDAIRFRTQPRRNVQTGLTGLGPFNVPGYEPGRHKLQVYLNGVKLIADEMAFAAAIFNNTVDGSADTGLVPGTTYDLNITVDGVGPTNISWTPAAFIPPDTIVDFIDLQNDINTALGLAAVAATCVFQDGALEFYSDTHGVTASIVVANGAGANPVFSEPFASAGGFNSFDTPTVGFDWGYREIGFYGDTNLSGTITINAALIAADVLEAIVLGDSGVA